MERVQRTVEIKLTPEECEILWKAEQLLREMEKEISGITTPVYQSDKEEIAECLRVFGKITSRYDVPMIGKLEYVWRRASDCQRN